MDPNNCKETFRIRHIMTKEFEVQKNKKTKIININKHVAFEFARRRDEESNKWKKSKRNENKALTLA